MLQRTVAAWSDQFCAILIELRAKAPPKLPSELLASSGHVAGEAEHFSQLHLRCNVGMAELADAADSKFIHQDHRGTEHPRSTGNVGRRNVVIGDFP